MNKKITMIDSGAYSVWQSEKEEIDVRAYGDYLLRQRDHYEHCVNLDVIPGTPKRPPSPEEADAAVEKSWENLHNLESLGLNPIPVYHQGEHPDALKRITDAGYDYVGISPDDSKSEKERQKFLDATFFFITDRKGWPIFKPHGFGVTSVDFMLRYPWYSLDSTTWKKVARYGTVFIPCQSFDGDFRDYTRAPIKLVVSEKSSKQYRGQSFFFLNPGEIRAWFTDFLEDEGFSAEEVESATEGYEARCRINLRVMQRVAQEVPVNPYPGSSWFADKFRTEGGLRLGTRKLIFAAEPDQTQNDLLTDESVFSRLLSYHKLRDTDERFLERYMFEW